MLIQKSENIGAYQAIWKGMSDLKILKKDIREYRIWKAMKARCYAPSNKNMGYYQKDNITVCDEWLHNFDNFIKDMGYAPTRKHSIERIDNLKGYSKDNCKWIPMKEQSRNRRNVKYFLYNGETKTLKEWAIYFDIKYDTLRSRVIRRNIPFQIAIETPVKYVKQVLNY